MNYKQLMAASVLTGFAATAAAAPTYVADFGADGPGTGLQDVLDSRTLDGTFDQNVKTDQYNPDEVWTLDAVASGNAIMMFEIAGNANLNSMGIYDLNDTSNRLTVFDGSAAAGYNSRLTINNNGDFVVTTFDPAATFLGQEVGTFSSFNFGFYLSTPDDTFFSQSAINGDRNADGLDDDHMIAIQGTGTDQIDTSGAGEFYGNFTANNFILAWEDLAFDSNGVDYDYNDLVVMVESFIPVPEPGTLALLGLGLLGLGAARRRKA